MISGQCKKSGLQKITKKLRQKQFVLLPGARQRSTKKFRTTKKTRAEDSIFSESSSSSSSSRFSTYYLEGILDQLKNEAHQDSTKLTYYNIWKNFNQFIIKLDRMPKSWEDRLSLYCAFLITVKNRKSSTIRTYVSAIKHVLKTDGYDWDDGKILLNTLTKSCKLKNDVLKVRLPIQRGLLDLILFKIQRKYQNQPYLEALYITAFLLQYFGLMRIGEIADSVHSIKAVNVHDAKQHNRLLIILYSSKTHGRDSQPQKIKILGNKAIEIIDQYSSLSKYHARKNLGKFCPVEWTRRFIQLRTPIKHEEENFFILSDGGAIQSTFLRNLLRSVLDSFDLDSSLYDTHSFRIGRATDLFKAGVNIEDIKQLGRWKSNAVYKYLKNL